MGKCKKRTLRKANSSYFMTRGEAINNIFRLFKKDSKADYKDALDLISLFGISAEELSEAGMSYEYLKALESITY